MQVPQSLIDDFLARGPWAVAGASTDRSKYGNKVLRCYQQHGMTVHPIHRNEKTIEGLPAFASVRELPKGVRGLSIITPPKITEQVVEDAAAQGIELVWMQPGAESPQAIGRAKELGLKVIAGGPCLLVALGFRDE